MSERNTEIGAPERLGESASGRAEEQRCPVCGVKLSLYNPGPNCYQHTIGRPWRGPSAKPKF